MARTEKESKSLTGALTVTALRDVLANQIDKIQDGSSTPEVVNAIAGAARTIVQTIKLELDYARLQGERRHIQLLDESREE